MTGFTFIASLVSVLHVAALSFAFGPWHWKYVSVALFSGALLWGGLPAVLPLRRRTGLLIGVAVALTVQQVAFWLWRAKLGVVGWPMVQFASVHVLIGLVFVRMRRRRPATFVWRGTMVKQRR